MDTSCGAAPHTCPVLGVPSPARCPLLQAWGPVGAAVLGVAGEAYSPSWEGRAVTVDTGPTHVHPRLPGASTWPRRAPAGSAGQGLRPHSPQSCRRGQVCLILCPGAPAGVDMDSHFCWWTEQVYKMSLLECRCDGRIRGSSAGARGGGGPEAQLTANLRSSLTGRWSLPEG